jgi:SAM-dependent methyltransferase
VNAQNIINWFKGADEPWMDFGDAMLYLHSAHPRTVFIKTLRRNACLLDVGAGDGSLHVYRDWPTPKRSDIKMYAYAMEKGENFDKFDGYELGEWPKLQPAFDGIGLDTIISSNFIEHIPDPYNFIEWAGEKLPTGGRLYLEWPTPETKELPNQNELIGSGIKVYVCNFHDDSTHKTIPDTSEVIRRLNKKGLIVDQQGIISNPFAEEEIRAYMAIGHRDDFAAQFALWSYTRSAQYLVATKI